MKKIQQEFLEYINKEDSPKCVEVMDLICSMEETQGKKLVEFEKSNMIDLLEQITSDGDAEITVRKWKDFLISYIKFVQQKDKENGKTNYLEFKQCAIFDVRIRDILYKNCKYYFDSVEDLTECVLSAYGVENSSFYRQMEVCGRTLSIFYLLWMFFSRKDIREIEVTDFNKKERTIAGKYIEEDIIFNTFLAYSELNYQLVSALYAKRDLAYTGYFIRLFGKDKTGKVSISTLEKTIVNVRKMGIYITNKEKKEKILNISTDTIERSSAVCFLNSVKIKSGDAEKKEVSAWLAEKTGISKAVCGRLLRDYNKSL